MDEKYKDQFELINNSLWLLIKPYIKDDTPYKNVMSELFKNYMENDSEKKKFTDEWWQRADLIYEIPEKYRSNQPLCGFAAEMAMALYELFKLQAKIRKDLTMQDYYKIISEPFLKEWERLKYDNGNTS